MTARPAKTAADYMAIALCPALIMLLVGSLVFFLLEISYGGEWHGRLQWTLFWFIFAMVLVSRIAIQQSTGAAFVYGLMLAGATSLLLTFYLGSVWSVWLILGIIWWTSNRIVWDCTLIDDDEDASGLGLLQVSRLSAQPARPSPQVKAVGPSESALCPSFAGERIHFPPAASTSPKVRKTPRPTPHRQTPHSPGLWVLYFAVGAVPIFGFGELLIPPADIPGRLYGFGLLLLFILSAFSLLLLTSFLGLRRYLRQRRLIMPGEIARQWVTTGLTIALSVIFLAILLPRPSTPYSASAWFTKLGAPTHRASRSARSSNQGAKGDGSKYARTEAGPAQGESAPPPGATASGRPENGPKEAGEGGGAAPLGSASLVSGIASKATKLFLILVLLAGVAIAFYRLWPEIRAGFASLLSLWTGWFKRRPGVNRRKSGKKNNLTESKQPELRPSPFLTGESTQMTPAELIRYSFDGLLRWAEARGFRVDPSETPLEVGERLTQSEPALRHEILLVAGYYSGVVYGDQIPPAESLEILKSLWTVIGFVSSKSGSRV